MKSYDWLFLIGILCFIVPTFISFAVWCINLVLDKKDEEEQRRFEYQTGINATIRQMVMNEDLDLQEDLERLILDYRN